MPDTRTLAAVVFALLGAAIPPADAAPDNTPGMALMGAYVRPDGLTEWGSGTAGSSRSSAGRYVITFVRPVAGCIVSMTPYDPDRFPYGGQIGISAPASIEVMLQTSAGGEADGYFYVLLFCNR